MNEIKGPVIVDDCPACLEETNLKIINDSGLIRIKCCSCGFMSEKSFTVIDAVKDWNNRTIDRILTAIEKFMDGLPDE